MKTLAADTHPKAEQIQLSIIAALPSWRKMEMIARLNEMLAYLAMSGLKERYPEAGDEELRNRFDAMRIGAALAQQLRVSRQDVGYKLQGDTCMTGDPVPTTLAVIAALDRVGIPYYITGSIASGVHGAYRATADVDIVADMLEEQADALAKQLGDAFYADAEMMRDAIRHCAAFNVIELATGFKVDIFIPSGRAFDRAQFQRRVLRQLAPSTDSSAYMAGVEGTVLAKLEWYRLGGETSSTQWSDLLAILKAQHDTLDLNYLRHWAAILSVDDLLARALSDAR